MAIGVLERVFKVSERRSTVGREVPGGVTTFMMLSYIIFVQPAMMEAAGIPRSGAFFGTCVASAIACVLMGLLANYPLARAPAIGHNVCFTYIAVAALGLAWQQAPAAVFIDGCLFVLLSFVGFRAALMEIIPDSLKRGIAAGIGLLITFIGFQYSGLVVGSPATGIRFGQIHSPVALLALFGLALTLLLMALNVRGAILWGIVGTTLAGLAATLAGVPLSELKVAEHETFAPTSALFRLDFAGFFAAESCVAVIVTFLFLGAFDSVGTLIGVSEPAGLLDESGRLPRARRALFSDAAGTVAGAAMGTSTISGYIESAAGVQAGARTGPANMVTVLLFLLSLLAYPLLAVVATCHTYAHDGFAMSQYPVLAPALIVVGSMMLKSLARLNWGDATEFFPAFLTTVLMPLTISITEGLAFGFVTYSLLKLLTGRGREVHWAFHAVSAMLVLRYVFVPP